MKAAQVSLLALALLTPESQATRSVVGLNGDCSVVNSTCPSANCCGLATPVSGTTTKKVCYLTTATSWTDSTNQAVYSFACDAVTVNAKSLTMAAGAVLSSVTAYMMA